MNWISIKLERPKRNQTVIATDCIDITYSVGVYTFDGIYFWVDRKTGNGPCFYITHWMELQSVPEL